MINQTVRRTLAAAAALAALAGTGVAQAQIANDGTGPGGSDLVLFVSDTTSPNFYMVDLGQQIDSALVSPNTVASDVAGSHLFNKTTSAGSFTLSSSLNIAAGANAGLAGFLSAHSHDTLQYSILAGDGNGSDGNGTNSLIAATAVGTAFLSNGGTDDTVTSGISGLTQWYGELNGPPAVTFPSTTFGWGSSGDTFGLNAPNTWVGGVWANGANVGTAMHFWELGQTGATFANVYESSNTIVLNADGSLTVGASGVPIPAAAWLFGSGLLGLLGIGRRKAALVTA
jgi:hypothetical protein